MTSPAEHERQAIAAYLVGADDESERAWEAAHRAALAAGDPAEAARLAFWLALSLLLRGQMAQAGGWLGRAESLVSGVDCPAAGYLLVPAALHALGEDPAAAVELTARATEIAERFGDADLRAFGVLGRGQALVALGDPVAGTACLDEVMVAVTAGEVGPITSGIVYCAVILECMALYDLPRATEWTAALSAWCDARPDLVPYRGQCLVHRSQLEQAAGRWPDALTIAGAARQRLADPPHPALGLAHYQEAELFRLTGAFDEADAAYRSASRCGHHPMPGLALLALDRGDAPAAAAAIRRALQEARPAIERPALLAAAVDILRGVADLPAARDAAEELAAYATASPSTLLAAMAAHARGAVLVDEGDAAGGLAQLRTASQVWQSLRMPYEAARTGVLLARACDALGDRATAALELDNARATFAELGAGPDLERLAGARRHDVLSEREREVLVHLASGKTNREIAAALVISQHTANRHVENIFAKLGVSNRSAATAYAFQHGLVS